MNKNVKKGMLFFPVVSFLSIIVASSVSWFSTSDSIKSTDISGSILRSYFDDASGNGETSSTPFVITRPIHYYNLVHLQYELAGFAEHGFYFQIGKIITEGDGYQVYSYADSGIAIANEYSTSLNMSYYTTEICPLGSASYPFQSHISGNNITISNLTVNGTGFSDVGVFGYVGSNATISNIYFEAPEIITSGSTPTELAGNDNDHITTNHDNNINVGYIAGHVKDSRNITNTYVNNCTILGDSGSYSQTNTYGYYGYVETNSEGVEIGEGDSYSFTLNASSIYSFIDSSVTNHGSETLVTRNTSYTPDSGSTISTALVSSSSYYQLSGNSPSSSSTYNYSLSTIGYYGLTYHTETTDYSTVNYLNGATYTNPSGSTGVSSYTPVSNPISGSYFYHNGTNWTYYTCNNQIDASTYSLSLSSSGSTSVSTTRSATISSSTGYLYIDDSVNQTFTPTTSKTTNSRTATISIPSLNCSLQTGTHTYAILVSFTLSTGTTYYLYYGTSSNGTLTGNTLSLTSNTSQSISLTSNSTTSLTYSGSTFVPTGTSDYQQYDLYGYNSATGEYRLLTNIDDTFIYNDTTWSTSESLQVADEGSGNVYLADNSVLTSSNYNANNIDIVGGLKFYSSYIFMEGYMKNVTAIADSDIGSPFYSTTYGVDTIALYIKNTGSEDLGHITFKFVSSDGSGTPQFNIGSSSSVTFETLGAESSTEDSYTVYDLDLVNSNMLMASYCVLDSDGNILAAFDSSGTQTYPNTAIEQDDIATYVLLLGVADGQTQVYEIDFDYVSIEGANGSFNSVGYRSFISSETASDYTITDTIINFYYVLPQGYNLSVTVYYNCTTKTYVITLSTSASISVNYFNYDTNNYTLIVNGTTLSTDSTVISYN